MMSRYKSDRNQVRRSGTKGFTLVEILIAMTITFVVIAGIMSFYIQFYKIGFTNEQRNRINRDIRQLTGELSRTGRQANDFFIYKSIGETDRDTASDRQLDGRSGDLLVFVFSDDSSSNETDRLIAYYRETDSSGQDALGPVKRFERIFDPASQLPVESLIPSVADINDAKDVVELSRGLSDGRLFYNFLGRSIMVNGQIYHGNDAKRVTETYNFTISPRG